MKIDLVSSNFQASNCLVYEGGKESGLDEVLRIESRKGFVRPQRKERLLTRHMGSVLPYSLGYRARSLIYFLGEPSTIMLYT